MTATFDKELLGMLELMVGIKVNPLKFLWSSRRKMAYHNIYINVSFKTHKFSHIKSVLIDTLVGNLKNKCIIYTNTASCLEQLQADVEMWLNINDDIQGNALIAHVALKPEVKFVSAERFTRCINNPEELIIE